MPPKRIHKKKVVERETKNERRRKATENLPQFSANSKGFTNSAAATSKARPNLVGKSYCCFFFLFCCVFLTYMITMMLILLVV